MKDEIFNKLLEYLQKTEDFALEHIPDVILQALRYEKISCIYQGILMLVLCMICGIIFYYTTFYPKFDKYGTREFLYFLGPFLSALACVLFFIQLCVCVDYFIKICIAPKYVLLQIIKNIVE